MKLQVENPVSVSEHSKRLRDLRPVMRLAGELIAREARRRAPVGPTKKLRPSLGHQEPAHNVTELTSPLPYARIQHRGGTVMKRRHMLTIPLNPEAVRLRLRHKTLRSVPGLTLIRTKSGKLFLVRIPKKRPSAAKFLFLLKDQVVIPGHRYAPSINEPRIRARVVRWLTRYITTGEVR